MTNLLGDAPMITVDSEAATLLAACNSVLNSMALQQISVPSRLLNELRSFCKEHIGFGVPFPTLAALQYPITAQTPLSGIMPPLIAAMGHQVGQLGALLGAGSDDLSPAGAMEALAALGQLELAMERMAMLLGWPRSTLKLSARHQYDAQHPEGIVKH